LLQVALLAVEVQVRQAVAEEQVVLEQQLVLQLLQEHQ
jgi:hypothetical protein